ncbi:class-II fumarase/aspartase family protein [Anianabacter salinae]|uniref:class-II fumarase/aspartase family protein n=1 Tax=Anianabacter salinae TaxID=2851023 RepID=UPI00225E16EF|nr:adenylosuccinate lyase family protein [Anianabacter salinae]MBV0912701.1 adenylosuccinate lyase family protein [Anianabacter salinae]
MAASVFDSAIYRDLFRDEETARLFSDTAEVRAMLLVEGALAKAQGAHGMIPETAAKAIHRASLEAQIDPAALAEETGRSAVVVPALVSAFRKEIGAPDHAQYAHWGATSQDIMDTGLVLRLRQVIALYETRLSALLHALADQAEQHEGTPMAARTYMQVASPTSFGAVVAQWGRPLLRLRARLPAVRDALLTVSLSGAAGTLSAMGEDGPKVRARLAEELGLSDPGATWHTERDRLTGFAAWMTDTATALGKMGEDLILLTQSGIGEVTLGQGGGSSTMPQKSNPIQPTLLSALARQTVALNSAMQGAAIHRQQRDGTAWFTEWMTLPQMCMGLGTALTTATDLARTLTANTARMRAGIDDGTGLIHAEALSFALARHMPRPEAQAEVKALCQQVQTSGTPLPDLAAARWPDQDLSALFTPEASLGTAPADARAFARAARTP